MSAPPEPMHAAPARPVLRRLIDIDPEPEPEPAEPYVLPPLADLPVLDPLSLLDQPPQRTDPTDESSQRQPTRRARRAGTPISPEQARTLTATVVRLVLEALDGRRPARQLATMLRPLVLAKLETTLRIQRQAGRAGLRLRTVRVCLPQPGVVEACAVIQTDDRCRAIALRLESTGTHWTCTALQLG